MTKKNSAAIFSMLLLILNSLFALDKGGESLDLSRSALPVASTQGKNLLKAGDFEQEGLSIPPYHGIWWGGPGLQGVTSDQRKAMMPNVLRLSTRTIVQEGSNRMLRLYSSPDLKTVLKDPQKITVTNSTAQTLKIYQSGKYILSFRSQGEHFFNPGTNLFRIIISFLDEKGNKRVCRNQMIAFQLTQDWKKYLYEVDCPPEAKTVSIAFFIYGLGEMKLDDVSFNLAHVEKKLEAELYPLGFIDRQFHIGSGQTCPLMFTARNASQLKLENPRLHLTLPEGYSVVGHSQVVTSEKTGAQSWVFNLKRARIVKSWYTLPPILIHNSLPPSESVQPAEFQLENAGQRGSHQFFNLRSIETFSGKRPRYFRTGMFSTSLQGAYQGDAVTHWVELNRSCGFNMYLGGYTPEYARKFKEAGFLRFAWPWQYLSDGYSIGGREKKPEEVLFRKIDGSADIGPRRVPSVCPVEVYTNGSYYQSVIKKMRKVLAEQDLYDIAAPNWEPQQGFTGCFCRRCCEEFIRYTKLPAAEVRQAWPDQILTRWKAQWVSFRSWQHGQLVGRIEQDLEAIGKSVGKECHFAIAITSDALRENGYRNYAVYSSEEYIHKLPWLNPWGPYVFRDLGTPYAYNNAEYLQTFANAREVHKFLRKRIQDPAGYPKIFAWPHGIQCTSWVTTPEAMSFETLCYFINRWNGSLIYLFPHGYDHRYFRALARTNTQIAAVEELVFKGTPLQDPTVTPVTPLPVSFYKRSGNRRFPDLHTYSLLQSAAYRYKDSYLIATGNFWKKGECYFKLHLPGLTPDKRYHLIHPATGEYFTAADNRPFTGKDLASGILLQTGALRWNFYLLQPAEKPLPGKLTCITAPRMEMHCREALPKLQELMVWEKNQLNLSSPEEIKPDYSGLKSLRNGELSMTPRDGTLLFARGKKETINLNLAKGGQITSWKYLGKEMVAGPEFSLGTDGTWQTPCMINGPFTPVEIKNEQNGIKVILQRKISVNESKIYQGMMLRKEFLFTPGRIHLKSIWKNTSGDSIPIQVRWQNSILPSRRSFPGISDVSRTYDVRGYQLTNPPEGVIHYNGARRISSRSILKPEADFVFPDTGKGLKVTIPQKELFHGFVTWDGGTLKAPTLEPVFHQVTLNAGISAEFSVIFSLID